MSATKRLVDALAEAQRAAEELGDVVDGLRQTEDAPLPAEVRELLVSARNAVPGFDGEVRLAVNSTAQAYRISSGNLSLRSDGWALAMAHAVITAANAEDETGGAQ